MNAAARAIHQSNLFSGQLFEMRLPKHLCLILILSLATLVSAVSVIYVINEHRSSVSRLQQLEEETQQYEMQWGQLLLEQASLATPARVEQMAVDALKMHLPMDKQTYVLQSQ